MMKKRKIFAWLTVAVALMAVSSCTGEAPEAGYQSSLDLLKVQDINVLGSTADTVFTIESNTAWSLSVSSGDETQLHIDRKTGTGTSQVRISPGQNPSALTTRQWTMQVRTETGLRRSFTITQSEAGATLMVSPESISAGAEGDTVNVSITSNTGWTVELTGQASGFVQLQNDLRSGSGDATFELVVQQNETTAARSGSLKITATDSKQQKQVKEIAIQQAAMVYILDMKTDPLNLPSSASVQTVNITSNSSWTATISGDDFVTIGEGKERSIKGTGNQTITLNVGENVGTSSRTAHLTVTMDKDVSQSRSIVIIQQGQTYTIILYNSEESVPKTGASFDVSFLSGNDWFITGTKSWVRLSKRQGTASDSIVRVTVDANPYAEIRSDTLFFNVQDNNKVVTYTAPFVVEQAGQRAPTLTIAATSDTEKTIHLSATYNRYADMGKVTSCGFYYSTSVDNILSGEHIGCSDVGNGLQSTFSEDIGELEPNATYYVAAYAVNAQGRGISSVVAVKVKGIDPKDEGIDTPDMP